MRDRKFNRFSGLDPLGLDKLFWHHDDDQNGGDDGVGHERPDGPPSGSGTVIKGAGVEVIPVEEEDPYRAILDWEAEGGH